MQRKQTDRASALLDSVRATSPVDSIAVLNERADLALLQGDTSAAEGLLYLPAFASREAALPAARQLSSKGVRDYYVVTAGDQENTISLGLFRDGENAVRRRDEIKAFGLDVQLNERTEDTPEYWLDYAVLSGQRFDWRDRVPDRLELTARDLPCGDLR